MAAVKCCYIIDSLMLISKWPGILINLNLNCHLHLTISFLAATNVLCCDHNKITKTFNSVW